MPQKPNRNQRRKRKGPANERTLKPVTPPADAPAPPPSLEPFKALGVGTQLSGRTRGEIRLSMQHVFDARIRPRLEQAIDAQHEGVFTTPLKDVIAIAELYARVGLGFVGTAEMDPADVAKLPAPVFPLAAEDAPLPEGKPDPVP
jgi:hypothetical protein